MLLLIVMQVSNLNVHFRVDESMVLEIETPIVDLGLIDPVSKELERESAINLKVYSNTSWQLMVKPEDDFVSTAGDVIPIDRLSFRVNGGDYIDMNRDGIILMKGDETNDMGKSVDIDVRLRLKWIDVAGDYSTTLTFTLMKL